MKIIPVAALFAVLAVQADFGFAQSASIAKTPFPALRDADNRYALTGTLVTPTQVIVGGTVFVVGDKIEAIGKSISLPAGVKNIQISGFIYPGLIDLHDHITWNFLPRWRAEEKFNNRYEWQARDAYLPALSAPHNGIVPPPPRSEEQENLACDANQYGEVKAIVGGATSIVDALGADDCIKGLARNLDSYSGLYPRGSRARHAGPFISLCGCRV